MNDVPIYFAFPDAALSYSCETCDQRCCKTGGLALFPSESETIVRIHPALELVAPTNRDGIKVYATPPSGCWFLEGSSCQLVEAHGGKLRPLSCQLFPFNIFGIVNATLVVAPNLLCPLKVTPEMGVRQTDLTEQMRHTGAAGEPPTPIRTGSPQHFLALERFIRDGAGTSLADPSPLRLLAFQFLLTDAYGDDQLADADLERLAGYNNGAEQAWQHIEAILGIEPPSPEAIAAITPLFNALTPSLRLFAFDTVPIMRLPMTLLSLAVYLAHWQSLRLQQPLLAQTIAQMVGSVGGTCALLSHWDLPWSGAPDPVLGLRPGVPPSDSANLPEDPMARGIAMRRAAYLWEHARTGSVG